LARYAGLWEGQPEKPMRTQRPSGIATVMFTDVEASTDITTRLGDDAAAPLFATHDRIIRDEVATHGGRHIRSTGDGFVAVFDSARGAVSCALSIQRHLAEHGDGLRVRIGLNAGEVLEGEDELFGAAVNLAARVMNRAGGNEIFVTDTVRQLAGTVPGARFRDRGRVALKGFPERHRLHEVLPAVDRRPPPAPPRQSSRWSRRTLALLGVAVLGALLAGAIALDRRSGSSRVVSVPPDSVAVIDARTNTVVDAIRVDESPGPASAGAGLLWILNLNSETVSRIDVRTRRLLRTQGIGETPGDLAASRDEVWIAAGCGVGGNPGALVHLFTAREGGIDLLGGDKLSLADVTPEPESRGNSSPPTSPVCGLAAEAKSVWVGTNVPPGLVRVDYDPAAERSRVVWARSLPHAPSDIAVGLGSVWAVDSSQDVIRRIDPKTGRVARVLRAGADPMAVAAGAGAVWVANEGDDSVSRIDPRTNAVSKSISVGDNPVAIAIGGGAVWVATSGDGSVTRIDSRTNRVIATIAVGHRPDGIAVARGSVWVTVRT
jgi:YVTN family beta-propeller protein